VRQDKEIVFMVKKAVEKRIAILTACIEKKDESPWVSSAVVEEWEKEKKFLAKFLLEWEKEI
jgi:hypothetical protein